MGGIIDQSSNLLDLVLLSSAEAEYNKACLTCMATTHLKMMLDELEGNKDPSSNPVPILLNNRSVIDMGASYKDTKHTRHIMQRHHYVHEGADIKKHTLIWIPTEFQLADLGTKVLTAA